MPLLVVHPATPRDPIYRLDGIDFKAAGVGAGAADAVGEPFARGVIATSLLVLTPGEARYVLVLGVREDEGGAGALFHDPSK